MFKLFVLAAVLAGGLVGVAQAQSSYPTYGTGSNSGSHSTGAYTTNQGTYVQPHQQTNPNNTQFDNFGTRGNVNPYTGQAGTRSPKF
jgi:hypothetical protein